MQVTRHSDTLMQLTKLRVINAWLVVEEDGLTLVDSMLGSVGNDVRAAAESLDSGPIVRIVLTHSHSDHTGGVDDVHRVAPAAELLVSDREAPILAGNRTTLPGEP